MVTLFKIVQRTYNNGSKFDTTPQSQGAKILSDVLGHTRFLWNWLHKFRMPLILFEIGS